MSALSDAGWVAPRTAGPTVRRLALLTAAAVVGLLAWLGSTFDVPGRVRADERDATLRVTIADDGSATVRDSRVRPLREVPVDSEVRSRGRTRFLVVRGALDASSGQPLVVRLRLPQGLDRSATAVRIVAHAAPEVTRVRGGDGVARLEGSLSNARYVVTLRAALLPRPPAATADAGALQRVTDPLDAQLADQRRERARVRWMRHAWWWLLPLGLVPAAVVVLRWRRASRLFCSMRRPGPGTDLGVAPPSSLDPVGVAAIVAGVHPADAADAFAGHVLDMVERRQLRMRRTLDLHHGVGCLIGLAQVEDEQLALAEDPAVALLRSVAIDGGGSVPLPDTAARQLTAPAPERAAWRAHVAARVRFERLLEEPPRRRLVIVTAVLGAIVAAALLVVVIADGPGTSVIAWYVAACAFGAGVTAVLWLRDASAWRRVVRTRRLERAQWLAWGAEEGEPSDVDAAADAAPAEAAASPAADLRNLPLLAAAGRTHAMSTRSSPDAVGLAAATSATIAALRTLADPRA